MPLSDASTDGVIVMEAVDDALSVLEDPDSEEAAGVLIVAILAF